MLSLYNQLVKNYSQIPRRHQVLTHSVTRESVQPELHPVPSEIYAMLYSVIRKSALIPKTVRLGISSQASWDVGSEATTTAR